MVTLTPSAPGSLTGTYVREAAGTLVNNVVDATLFPLTGNTDTEALTKSEAFAGALSFGVIGMVVGSKLARSRINGDPNAKPILGLIG